MGLGGGVPLISGRQGHGQGGFRVRSDLVVSSLFRAGGPAGSHGSLCPDVKLQTSRDVC